MDLSANNRYLALKPGSIENLGDDYAYLLDLVTGKWVARFACDYGNDYPAVSSDGSRFALLKYSGKLLCWQILPPTRIAVRKELATKTQLRLTSDVLTESAPRKEGANGISVRRTLGRRPDRRVIHCPAHF